MFLNAEPEVSRLREILSSQLELTHPETTLEDLLGLCAADRAVNGDFLVSTDAK